MAPTVAIEAMGVESLLIGESGLQKDQNDWGGTGAKRHNDFWSDMEETASSWPKGKSVWDD